MSRFSHPFLEPVEMGPFEQKYFSDRIADLAHKAQNQERIINERVLQREIEELATEAAATKASMQDMMAGMIALVARHMQTRIERRLNQLEADIVHDMVEARTKHNLDRT